MTMHNTPPPPPADNALARTARFVGAAAASLLVVGFVDASAWALDNGWSSCYVGPVDVCLNSSPILQWASLFLAVLLTPPALVWVSRLFIAALRASLPPPPLAECPVARTAQFVGAAVASLLVVGPVDASAWGLGSGSSWALLFLAILLTPAALVWATRLFIASVRSSTPPLAERPMARTAQFVGAAVASLLVVGPLDVIAWQMIAWQGSVDGSVWTCGVLAVLLIPAAMVWVTPLSADRRIARTAQRVGAATASMAAMVTLVLVGLKMLQPAINLCPSSPCLAVRTIGSGRVPNFPCTSACSPEVILTATPSRGWVFTGWGCYAATWGCTYPWPGSGCAGTGTCTVWVTDDSQYILTATFRRITGGKP